MEVRCDKCQARYRVDDARIGPQGLTMRCGKCQNTFKVMRSAAAVPPPDGPPPAPAARPAAPQRATPSPAAPANEGAGRTMMFQTGNIKSAPAAKPAAAKPPERAPDPVAGSTMIFGQSPAAKAVAPAPRAAPKPVPAPALAPPPEAFAARMPALEEPAAADEAQNAPESSGLHAAGAQDLGPPVKEGAFDRAPPRGLLIGVAAGLTALIIAAGALVAVKKLGKHPPPPAAVETLASAQADADQDTLAAIASAEGKARDAIDIAGKKADFPEATAALARIEIQWADALNDQASLLAASGGDAAEAKVTELQTKAKARLRSAFETLSPAIKANRKSPDLQLALADYYRAQRSGSSMNKALKSAQALKADEARVSLVQGLWLQQDGEGAEKAIPKLKAAAAANPQSARLHFRLALAYLAAKDDADASAELKQTLKISPQHDRAKAAMAQLAATASAEGK